MFLGKGMVLALHLPPAALAGEAGGLLVPAPCLKPLPAVMGPHGFYFSAGLCAMVCVHRVMCCWARRRGGLALGSPQAAPAPGLVPLFAHVLTKQEGAM